MAAVSRYERCSAPMPEWLGGARYCTLVDGHTGPHRAGCRMWYDE